VVAAVILAWDNRTWDRWDYRAAVEQAATSGRTLQRWEARGFLDILPGTEAWLLARGNSDAATGLTGHGVIMSEPYKPWRQGEPGPGSRYVTVAFDALLPLGEQIRPGILRDAVPGVPWDQSAGVPITILPASSELDLRRLWQEHAPTAGRPGRLVAGTYPPDAVAAAIVNRFEQDPDARRMCLAFHGTSCAVCGFSFEVSYGLAGSDAVDVHHVVPPALLGPGYQLDPIADLIPLCPNCHAMAHHGVRSPRSVSELRNILSAAGHLPGHPVSPQSLAAEEDARRILEAGTD
jgi:5-methylcytosine-specific restriction protein A